MSTLSALLVPLAILFAALLGVPIRIFRLVVARAQWAERWRGAGALRRGLGDAGLLFMGLAACEWLALVAVILKKLSDHQFLGGSGQAGLIFFIVIIGLALTMLIAMVIGELLLIPLRRAQRPA